MALHFSCVADLAVPLGIYMVCMSQSQRNLEFLSQQNGLVNVVDTNGSLGQPMVVSARQSGLSG